MSDNKHDHTKSKGNEDKKEEAEEGVVVQGSSKDGEIYKEEEYNQAEVAPDLGPEVSKSKCEQTKAKNRSERIAALTAILELAEQESTLKEKHRRRFQEINFPGDSMHQQETKIGWKHHTAEKIKQLIGVLREWNTRTQWTKEEKSAGYKTNKDYSLKEETDESGVISTTLMRKYKKQILLVIPNEEIFDCIDSAHKRKLHAKKILHTRR